MTNDTAPLWRSLLFIPAVEPRFLAKAADRDADAVIIDLEDSIPPDRKTSAREALSSAVATVDGARRHGRPEILVRVNRPWRLAVADLEAAVLPGVDGLCLPKVDGADHVREVAALVSELEGERGLPVGRLRFYLLIETPKGVAEVREIAKASRRVAAITLGGEDLSAELGLPSADPAALAPYMATVLLAAREAGVMPMGYPGSIAEFSDLDSFRRCAEQGRRDGFEGGSCIHPAQVPILNAAFSPSADEVAHAEGVLEAFEAALASGSGAVAYQGKMLDKPIVDRARRIVEKKAALHSSSVV